MFSIWIRYTNNSIEVICFSHLCRIESRYPRKLENAEEGNENLHSLLRHASYFLLLNRHRCSMVYKYKRLVYHNPLQCRTTELTSRNRNLLIVKFVIYGGIRKANNRATNNIIDMEHKQMRLYWHFCVSIVAILSRIQFKLKLGSRLTLLWVTLVMSLCSPLLLILLIRKLMLWILSKHFEFALSSIIIITHLSLASSRRRRVPPYFTDHNSPKFYHHTRPST